MSPSVRSSAADFFDELVAAWTAAGGRTMRFPCGLFDVVPDEVTPPVRYPRDPSLDPQLGWRGKDERDEADLEVTTSP